MSEDQGYRVDSTGCDACGSPTIIEFDRGWWCTNPACELTKKREDVREGDKYVPKAFQNVEERKSAKTVSECLAAFQELIAEMQNVIDKLKKANEDLGEKAKSAEKTIRKL